MKELIPKKVKRSDGQETTVWVRPKGKVGRKRKDMPQVDSGDYGIMKLVLMKLGITIKEKKFDPHTLKPSQIDFDIEKIKANDSDKPILISKDNHIADGHHRWGNKLSAKVKGKAKVNGIKIGMPIDDLLFFLDHFCKIMEGKKA